MVKRTTNNIYTNRLIKLRGGSAPGARQKSCHQPMCIVHLDMCVYDVTSFDSKLFES